MVLDTGRRTGIERVVVEQSQYEPNSVTVRFLGDGEACWEVFPGDVFDRFDLRPSVGMTLDLTYADHDRLVDPCIRSAFGVITGVLVVVDSDAVGGRGV